ncbi:MAG: hypothetical protein MZV65_16030 [Chromatiales bacterium]|nr:hypothetical protein [Chromatiales bacterium]
MTDKKAKAGAPGQRGPASRGARRLFCDAAPREYEPAAEDRGGLLQLGPVREPVDPGLRHRLRRHRAAPADDQPLRHVPLRHPAPADAAASPRSSSSAATPR